jgi:transposase
VRFEEAGEGIQELHIDLGFHRGTRFECPTVGCEASTSAYDTSTRTWRHLDFFQYKAFIHAPLPRVKCPEHGVKTVEVPWARAGSDFTLLFEAFVLELARHMPVDTLAELVGEHDTRLWRFILKYIEAARERLDFSCVNAIGVDETSRKGHSYLTLFADLASRSVLYVTEGKDHTTVDRFACDFFLHGGCNQKVKAVTCDMSPAFKKGVAEDFPNARRVIDKFHVIKHANEAVDKVRKEEARSEPLLKKTKYLWLKNDVNLTDAQRAKKEGLGHKRLKTARAYAMRVTLQDIYAFASTRVEAAAALGKLCSWMARSRLVPMKKLAGMLKDNEAEILNYFDNRVTNAIMEGTNSIVQNIKRRARGFRNNEYFKAMIYLNCSGLDLTIAPA